jgi:GTP-binding protein
MSTGLSLLRNRQDEERLLRDGNAINENGVETSYLPLVSIIGLPNVGKSTLFNRLIGQRRAIVHKTPGVTRDRNMADTEWGGVRFFLVDTGGLMPPNPGELEKEVENQVHRAIQDSDLILFLVDGSRTVSPIDNDIANFLRRANCPVLLVANKVDRPEDYASYHAYSSIGLGEPFPVSASRGINCGDLLDLIVKSLPEAVDGSDHEQEPIKIAVVGRPNAGKSSLINYILGEERLIVHHEGGTTRDSIDTWIEFRDQTIVLIDTAGLRRKSRIEDDLEYYANVRVVRSINRADIVILLIDSGEGIVRQDLHILSLVEKMGKGMIIAFSKWDLLNGDADQYRTEVHEDIPHFAHIPDFFTSAVTGTGIRELLETALKLGSVCKERIRTPVLNRLLEKALTRRSPPAHGSKPVKLFYITQTNVSPHEFVIIASSPRGIKAEYQRYLTNFLRNQLELGGIPIRIKFRERKRERRVRE